jgi:hypothetical protein
MVTSFTLRPNLSLTENLTVIGVTHSRATGRGNFSKRDLRRGAEALGAFTVTQIWAALHKHAGGVGLVDALDQARGEVS